MVAAQKHQAAIQQLGVAHLFACALLLTVVVAASHALDPDHVRRWVGDVYRAQRMQELYDPSPHPLLDTQLKDALLTVIDGTAKQKAQLLNDQHAKGDKGEETPQVAS